MTNKKGDEAEFARFFALGRIIKARLSERGSMPWVQLETLRFVEERTALRILAWCGERPDERALRAREHFLHTSPEAVLAARVREACMPAGDGSP